MQRLIAACLVLIGLELAAIMYMLYPATHTYLASAYGGGGYGTLGTGRELPGNTGPSIQHGTTNIPIGAISNQTGTTWNGGSDLGTGSNLTSGGGTLLGGNSSGGATAAGGITSAGGAAGGRNNGGDDPPGGGRANNPSSLQLNSTNAGLPSTGAGGPGTLGTAGGGVSSSASTTSGGQCNTMGQNFNYATCQRCDAAGNPKCPEGTLCRSGGGAAADVCVPEGYPTK